MPLTTPLARKSRSPHRGYVAEDGTQPTLSTGTLIPLTTVALILDLEMLGRLVALALEQYPVTAEVRLRAVQWC